MEHLTSDYFDKYINTDKEIRRKQNEINNDSSLNRQLKISSILWWFQQRINIIPNEFTNKERKELIELINEKKKEWIKSLSKSSTEYSKFSPRS